MHATYIHIYWSYIERIRNEKFTKCPCNFLLFHSPVRTYFLLAFFLCSKINKQMNFTSTTTTNNPSFFDCFLRQLPQLKLQQNKIYFHARTLLQNSFNFLKNWIIFVNKFCCINTFSKRLLIDIYIYRPKCMCICILI